MTPPASGTAAYITVPIPAYPFHPTVPVPQEGAVLHQEQAQAGANSLVPSVSITSTAPQHPSEIALSSLGELEALPYNNDFHKYHGLCENFVKYLDLCEQKGFTAHGYDVKSGKFVNVPLEYENRWSHNRRAELSKKLERLEYWFELQADRPVTMITLTCYHEGMSISDAWHALNVSRVKLLKLIAKYFDSPDYFWVPEPHKSGYVHYHLAVFADVSNNVKDSQGKGIEDKFRDLWSRKYKTGNHTYGLDFSQKKGDEKLRSLKNYLSKYLQKGFLMDHWSPSLLVFNAHLWDTGFRMYGASKRVSEIMKEPEREDNTVVWLETKIQDVKTIEQPDGTTTQYDEERVVWYRQYIPDWLDSPFWLQDANWHALRLYEPDPVYIYDWGRPIRDISKGYDPTYGLVTHVDDL